MLLILRILQTRPDTENVVLNSLQNTSDTVNIDLKGSMVNITSKSYISRHGMRMSY